MNTAKTLLETQEPGSLGVYVHFPWCARKCPYCDFLSIASEREEIPHAAYADALIRELGRRAGALGPRRLQSVFFGGGTPSLWAPAELGRVLRAIGRPFRTGRGHGRVQPSSLIRQAQALLAGGANRLSGAEPGRQTAEFLGG
jgi:oxygen-independent coproporphyrinogen-3 oxidase